ncbi:hypothetical protein NHP20013_10820 [Helicobacter bizzozeronii]|nr:hypothetical protein NHP20013_10820 [Helicobacter bizzozeronii]
MWVSKHPHRCCARDCGGGGGRSPPPNAIAYGSGYIPMKGMIKAGFWLNVMGIGLISLFAYTAITQIFVR